MFARLSWLSLLTLSACVRDVENHCANKPEPDAYCGSIAGVGEFCSQCESNDYGCVAVLTEIQADCRPDGATSVADDGTTGDSSTNSTSGSADDNSASASSSSADVTTDDGGSSETTGPPPAVCGNDLLEEGEVCDGSVGEYDCFSLGHGTTGTLTCDEVACEFDFSECMSPAAVCGDGVVNQMEEECDTTDFDLQDCDSVPGYGIGTGELVCTADCEIDPTACCFDDGQPCTENAQCCNALLKCGAIGHKCGGL